MNTKLENYNGNHNSKIDKLFEDAREKLEDIELEAIDKIEEIKIEAKGKKKQIVVALAKNLEGTIPSNSICNTIVIRLKGKVDGRFIRGILPEKYKQEYRSNNGKMQKKIKVLEKLAGVTPLKSNTEAKKQQDEDKKRLQPILLVNTDGSTTTQNYDDTESSIVTEILNTNNSESSTIQQSSRYQQQQQQSFQEKNYDEEKMQEYSNSKDSPSLKNQKLNELNQLVFDENYGTLENKINTTANNNILNFEFFVQFGTIREYIESLNPKLNDNDPIWFEGELHKITRKVV
ncbi:MAG TPA: hypothetical protein VIY08_03885, partial [Candidatus Nitrosocosmicus sp.]